MHRFAPGIAGLALVIAMGGAPVGAQDATPAATPAAAPIEVNVELNDFSVTPSMTALIAGQPYRFVVTNAGKETHEFVLEAGDVVDKPLDGTSGKAEIADIAPGATKEMTWTFTKPGAYQMACHVPEHFEAGMMASFTVVPDDTEIVQVEVGDMFVKPATTSLKAGTPYLFEVTNTGAAAHELVFEPAGADDKPLEAEINGKTVESEAEDIAPGETKTLLWTFTDAGAYQMACHVPGHYEAGMTIDFTVAP